MWEHAVSVMLLLQQDELMKHFWYASSNISSIHAMEKRVTKALVCDEPCTFRYCIQCPEENKSRAMCYLVIAVVPRRRDACSPSVPVLLPKIAQLSCASQRKLSTTKCSIVLQCRAAVYV